MVTAAVAPELRTPTAPRQRVLAYLLLGIVFGVVLTKSEVVSWFRIQEMFRFQSFHMYGVIGSAVAVAATSVALIGSGATVFVVAVLAAVAGTWLYGFLRPHLPH